MILLQLSVLSTLIATHWSCLMLLDGSEPEADGTYIALFPRILRPGLPFTLSLHILRPGKNYVAEIEIRNSQNRTIASNTKRNIQSGKPVIMQIDEVPAEKLQNNSEYYHVNIKGKTAEGSVMFEDKKYVLFIRKSVSIFIQTDKAVYIPGAEVKFRVIVVKPDLKPYKGSITVKILDPKENIVKQWLDSPLNTGVYSQFLQLSKDPPLGDWKIEVKAKNGELFSKTFSVEKYVLPKFDVTLDILKISTVKDDIVVTVKARYTYGKAVDGSVLLIACNFLNNGCVEENYGEINTIQKSKTMDKNGQATFRITKGEIKKSEIDKYSSYSYDVRFMATVTEDITEIERTAIGQVTVPLYDAYIKIFPIRGTLKFGLGNKFLIALKQHDGSPIIDDNPYPRDVKLTIYHEKLDEYGTDRNRAKMENRQVRLDGDGTKIVQIDPITETINYMRVVVIYDPTGKGNFSDSYPNLRDYLDILARRSPTNSFVELLPTKDVVKAGENVKFQFISTEKRLKFVTIQVISRGNIVLTKTISTTKESDFIEFPTTSEMAPKSQLIIYAIPVDSSEILADTVEFRVTGLLQNDVKLSVSKDSAKPGEKTKIVVKTHPGSFVGLVAIDQSVLLLKDNKAITADTIERDIKKYSSSCYQFTKFSLECEEVRTQLTYLLRRDAYSVFKESGVGVLTDAYLHHQLSPGELLLDNYPDIQTSFEDYSASLDSDGSTDHMDYRPINKETPFLRTRFPETWLWMDFNSGSDGEVSFVADIPDTITSWVIDVFAVQKDAGLGISPHSATIQVFQPFFIRLNLPYSIKRGEKLGLQVLVFNYLSSEQSVTVTLKHKDNSGFDFVKKSGRNLKPNKGSKNYNVRSVKVPGNGGSSAVFFPIVATKIGEIKLHVKAIGSTASDAVKKSLLVEQEGFRVERNIPVLVELSKTKTFEKVVVFKFPSEAVAGSQKSQISLTGDIMGPVLYNIKNLVKMPHGCGEQNMIDFVPNIVVMRYLKATNRLTENMKSEATQNMEAGYQQELAFQHADNSYSCFGDEDVRGSTWLTAFVVRSFKQAEPYIFIDKEKIKKSLQFLVNKQKKNGEFVEKGEVYQTEMQGGASNGDVSMTAYVLVTLLENGEKNQKAVQFIEERLNKIKGESCSLALAAYALHLADSPKKDKALQMLEDRAIPKDGMKYWSDEIKIEQQSYWPSPDPVDVETTGYALLTYVLRNQISEALPIVLWLVKERNAYGGYSSTQDTVVALQALGAYAEKVYKKDNSINIEIDVKNGQQKKKLIVQHKNVLSLQTHELGNPKSAIHLKAKGKGVAFAQVQYSYYMTKMQHGKAFDCDKSVIQTKDDGKLMVAVCCKYKKPGKSSMAVMEVEALSGYSFNVDDINQLTDSPKIQRVELEKGDTKTNLYFKSLGKKRTCVNITSNRIFDVSEQKEVQLVLFDYYEPSDRIEASYSARHAKSLSQACPHCWDGVLEEKESRSQRSGKCKDTARQCRRLKTEYCSRNDSLAQWMHKKCQKMCKLCR